MNIDIEDLKSQWRNLDHTSSLADEVKRYSRANHVRKATSAPERIASIYRRTIIVGVIWIPLSFLFARNHIIPLWLALVMMAFFAVMVLANARVFRLARNIDLTRMSMLEALDAVCRLQRSILVQRVMGVVLVVPLLTVMLIIFSNQSEVMLLGGVCGAIIGTAIGLSLSWKVRCQIRHMRRVIDEALESEREIG